MDTGDTYTIYCDNALVCGPYHDFAAAQMRLAQLEWDEKARTRPNRMTGVALVSAQKVYRIAQG